MGQNPTDRETTVSAGQVSIEMLWREYLALTRWLDCDASAENVSVNNAVCSRRSAVELAIMAHAETSPFAVAAKLYVLRLHTWVDMADEGMDFPNESLPGRPS